MKKFSVILTLFMLFVPISAISQSVQPCVVKQYNQKEEKTPLQGVEVMVSNAGSTVSDGDGKLTLVFRTLRPGDKVNLVSAKKAGFELMNKDAVNQWNIAADQRVFEIVMVNSEYFAQLKSRLRQTSTDSYKSKYEKAVQEVEALKRDAKISEEDYYRKLDELETQYMNSLKNIDTYIDQFARIDLSEVSAEEQRILEMVEEGKIDEAVEAYEALDISGKLRQARENKKALAEAKAKITEEEANQDKAIRDLKEKQSREIATLKLAGGKENYDKVGLMLKENALADTTDVYAVFEYAYFAYNQHDYAEAERFYLMALDIYTELYTNCPDAYRPDLARAQTNLGVLYYDLHDYNKAEHYFLVALEIFTALFNQNPDSFRADLAIIQRNLGALYSDLHINAKAEEYYLKALNNHTILFTVNPDAYLIEVARTQNNLGSLYSGLLDFNKAEEYYLKSLHNSITLFSCKPDIYRDDLALTQRNLGTLYSDLHNFDKAEDYLLEALNHYTVLFTGNPDAYLNDLARTQNNLGNLYSGLHDYVKAEEYYLKALDNKTVLFNKNPDAFRADLAITQSNLGTLYSDLHDYVKAEEYYLKALDNKTVLFNKNPDAFRESLSTTQSKLGDLYNLLSSYTNAEHYYLMALENYTVLFAQQPDSYRREIAWIQYSLMFIYTLEHAQDQSDTMLEAALANFEELYKEDNSYQSRVAELRLQKGVRAFQNDKIDEALELFESSYQLAPEESAPGLAAACYIKAYEYLKVEDYTKALESIDKAIAAMPENAHFYETKGEILLSAGDEKGALEMWKKVMELDPEFLSKNPDNTALFNGLTQKGLITE